MKSAKTKSSVTKTKDKSQLVELNTQMDLLEHESFSGPLPSPEYLEAYNKIDPTFAERIMKMAEENNKASITQEKETYGRFFVERSRGQWLSFGLGVLSLSAGVVLALMKLPAPAISAILGGLAPVIIASINTFFKR